MPGALFDAACADSNDAPPRATQVPVLHGAGLVEAWAVNSRNIQELVSLGLEPARGRTPGLERDCEESRSGDPAWPARFLTEVGVFRSGICEPHGEGIGGRLQATHRLAWSGGELDCSACDTAASSVAESMGLCSCPWAPRRSALRADSAVGSAVIISTGRSGRASRIFARTAKPSISGSSISRSTNCGTASWMEASPSFPVAASRTAYPARPSKVDSDHRLNLSSSITRIGAADMAWTLCKSTEAIRMPQSPDDVPTERKTLTARPSLGNAMLGMGMPFTIPLRERPQELRGTAQLGDAVPEGRVTRGAGIRTSSSGFGEHPG